MPATVAFDYPTAVALAVFVRGSLTTPAELSTHQEHSLTLSIDSTASFTAVCAIAARYPLPSGATPLDSTKTGADHLWHTLSTGANLPVTVPVSRWDIDDVYSPEATAKKMSSVARYVRFGCFVDAVEDFDAGAFRIASGEAVAMDPQCRIALEQMQEAMHAAGGNIDGEAAATGTYFGCMYTEYLDAILGPSGVADSNSTAITGHGLSFLVGRIAYTFGLQGPCVSTDTACSSSLVAMHLAHQGLMSGETAAAAAGGVNALSPVGRCKTFDASGDGYGRGEGFTVAYLRGGQHARSGAMLAVMCSSAVNQDGRSSSLTAPNGPSQQARQFLFYLQALVSACLLGASLGAETVRYVAVHGTGTPLGDPIEVGALGSALGQHGSKQGLLTLGSNKACYGHTEGTAGITGVLMAITALQQAAAAPIVNLRTVNPYVTAALSDWRSLRGIAAHAPRQLAPGSLLKGDNRVSPVAAGTSSFGMSGVNAHALFSAPDVGQDDSSDESTHALTWQSERHWVVPAAHGLLRSFTGGEVGGTCIFSVDLSAPSLAYLLHHQVMGRPLLPGAGLLEMAAAAGMALAGAKLDAVPVLAQAIISSPCQLSVGGAAQKLTCTLHPRQGSVQIATTQLHLTGLLTHLLPAGRHAPKLAPLKSSSQHSTLAGQINRLQGTAEKRQVAANVGFQGVPKQDMAGYGVHPALGDACIHLAAVPPAGQPIMHVRVPVSVGARTGVSSSAKTSASGFCVAQPDGGNADNSTLNHMHWVGQGGSAQMQIHDLLAKVMATPKPTPLAASNIIYEVQWQALACTNSQSSQLSHLRRFSSQQASVWELSGKENNGTPVAWRSRRRRLPRGFTPVVGLQRAALHAQRHLADLQALLLASKRGGRLALATTGGRSGDQPDQMHGAPLAIGLAAAPVWALLKVAAAEMGDKEWHMGGHSADWASARQLPTELGLSQSGIDNIHGPAMSGGVWAAPKLLPVAAAAARSAKHNGSMPRNILVSGGLGALGSLVAVWLAGQDMSAHAPNLTLLGRSGRVTDPDTTRILAESQSQASVTMTKCDVALSADAEAVTSAQAGLGCPALDCIIHAGGVLKDALLANQSAQSVRQAFAAKAAGAAQLAARSAGLLPVATGVAFSSIAGLLGSAGQGNYAAANAVLDEWSAVQSKQGMNMVSIQWGAWAGAGMAAHDNAILARLHRVGLGAIRPADGLVALQTALTGNASPQMAGAVFKWERLLVGERASMHFYAEFAPPIKEKEYKERSEEVDAARASSGAVNSTPTEGKGAHEVHDAHTVNMQQNYISDSGPHAIALHSVGEGNGGNGSQLPWAGMQPAERTAWVQAAILQAVNAVLGREVGPEEPLMSAGLDSLGAVELRKELSRLTTLDLPATLVFDYPSTDELTAALAVMLPEPVLPEQAGLPAAKSGRKAKGAESAAESAASSAKSAAAERPQHIKAWRPPQRDDITAQVLAAVKTVMGADVSVEASLMSAGLDSLGAVELRKELASVTGLDLPTTLVFDYPSAESITDLIVSMLPSGLQAGESPILRVLGSIQAALAKPQEQAAVNNKGGNHDQTMVSSAAEIGRSLPRDNGGLVAIVPDSEENGGALEQGRQPRPPPVNPQAPRLTKDDYFTVPDMRRLKRMRDDELKAVERFVVGRKDVGEVAFIDPVDLRGVDLDAILDMDKGRIQVYGVPGGAPRPAAGEGLNRPALLTFRRMLVKQKSESSVAKFRTKLVDHAAKLGGVFVHYDADTGNWIMKVDHF
ncbi:probable inactive phenolphthiocerol synthesis polyketide s at N-terminal half [Coccomyxa sp. Obi]|nr:probable inactive phenolphthiocerol synthesis polyketide s at N-terminal half [Coccomyxa sp. Obi]